MPRNDCLVNEENYGYYKDLAKNGYQVIHTDNIDQYNIDMHFQNIMNILYDGIYDKDVTRSKIHVIFPDNEEVNLFIIQYMFNLMFWTVIVKSEKIQSYHIFFERRITVNTIAKYIDRMFLKKNIDKMDNIELNRSIDDCIGKFRAFVPLEMWLCNTLDFKDTTDFMDKYPEFNKAIHFDISGIDMEDIKEEGLKASDTMISYITRADSDHNAKYPFISGEGINKKQFKEVMTNIGTKPNGQGGVFPHAIATSYINGGLKTIEDVIIDSSIGRIAQILTKQNVGQSGAFARYLGLNNQNSKLHQDPSYSCATKYFEKVYIKDQNMLDIFDMRWYRFTPRGVDKLIDSDRDQDLIGKTILLRSPMTCESAAKGHGICYKCYGNLAYINRNINIGQIAAEALSAIYTQKLLSAKHLLESAIIKMEWVKEFHELFDVEFDQIILKDDIDYRKMKIIIKSEDLIVEDSDETDPDIEYTSEMEEGVYIYSFVVVLPGGKEVTIRTGNSDPIYLTADLQRIINNNVDDSAELIVLEMNKLKEENIPLFAINVQNDELSKVMNQVKSLIDNKASIKEHDKDSILQAFIEANLSGGIKINSVLFETLLMNQIRSASNILDTPDWEADNAKYQILTLSNSLTNNPSINVRLQAPKIKKTLISPSNRFMYKTSTMDLFAMEHPQDFIEKEFRHIPPTFEDKRKIITPVHKVEVTEVK